MAESNQEIASFLREIAVYKELAGDNVFKIRAFQNAARTVDTHSEAVSRLAREDRLGELPGVGKGLGDVIREIVETGESSELEALKGSIPAGLADILALPGLGPRKVKTIWEKLGVTEVAELEQACRENRVAALEGFGAKSQEKILQGIEFRKTTGGFFLIPEAMESARQAAEELRASGLFIHVDIAGSLRRGKSLYKDADILVVPAEKSDPREVQARLLAMADGFPDDQRGVIAAGETKVSLLRGGMQIDFRIVDENAYPAALQHFTGSKEHNTLLRSRAKSRGMKMNEYGVFQNDEPLALRTEEDVYRALDIAWIPPELREGAGEIEAAEKGELPELVRRRDFKGMIHVHTHYSDGLHSIRELAAECIRRGFAYLCLSDHSRSAFYAGGLNVERLAEQRAEVDRVNRDVAPFRVFCGIESDILADGSLDYPDDVLAELDFVIGSVHSGLSMDPAAATERLLRAVGNPWLTMLGHPSGRLLLERKGYTFDENAVFGALAERGGVLEHNCHPRRLDPEWDSLKKAGALGIRVSVNTDAHSIRDFDTLEYGVTMARKAWLEADQVLNCMSVEEIQGFFEERKAAAKRG